MATIVAYGVFGGGEQVGLPSVVDFADVLSTGIMDQVDHSSPIAPLLPVGCYFGPVTSTLPIQELEAAVAGVRAPSFLNDYYERIHIIPGSIALGNLLSTQTRNVEVWNSFLDSKLLSSVTQVGTDGITFAEPEPAPTYFAALESRTYQLTVSTNGSPIIDAHYTFNFPASAPELTITGRRVVIWPFIPETGHTEVLEWKTDILRSFNNEQRLAIRSEARQSFSHEFILTPEQFTRAKAMSTQWAHRVYGIGVWSEATLVKGLLAGSVFIQFDTAFADYRDNDIIMLWESDSRVIALEISTVEANGVNLKLPLEANWDICFVAPLRFSRTLSGMDYKRGSNEVITARSTFSVTQNTDLSNEGSFPLYRTKPVLTERYAVVDNPQERIVRSVDLFDNGSGPIEVDITTNTVRHLETIGFIKQKRSDIWALRQWIHARRGKQKAFWLPSWNADLVVVDNIASASSSITVKPIGYPLYYGVKDIMVQLLNGTKYFNRIESSQLDVNNNELLILGSAFGVEILAADIDFVCFMSHVRFDSDRITFKRGEAERLSVSIPVVETAE